MMFKPLLSLFLMNITLSSILGMVQPVLLKAQRTSRDHRPRLLAKLLNAASCQNLTMSTEITE